jgi:phage gp36-like protein
MFLSKSDLHVSILPEELDEITRDDDTLVLTALEAAEAEMRMYLFDTFDVDAIFSAVGSARNKLLVNHGADIAIYLLVARGQGGQDFQDRKDRYDRAIKYLKAASKTEYYVDLPRRENTVQTVAKYGSNPKRSNYY